MFGNLIENSTIKKKKSKIEIILGAHVSFLMFACIYLITYKCNMKKNLFPKKVIAIPITPKILITLQQNLTSNYPDQTSKI